MENIKLVAVIGAGALGTGLARTIAAANFNVMIIEKDKARAEQALEKVRRDLDYDISKWRLTNSEREVILSRLITTAELSRVAEADLIIEAITEDFEAKSELLSRVQNLCCKEVILITTTAALSITRLAAKVAHPELFIGMNFQLPVPRVPVVEVVSGYKTSDFTREKIAKFATRLKKEVITVNEYPGYVTTRVILPFINEAMYVVMEGVATAEDVDKAIKLAYNLQQGPLSMADHIGLDTVLHWMEYLFHELGDLKYRPCPLLRKLVNANHLGIKTGDGIFTYDKGENEGGPS